MTSKVRAMAARTTTLHPGRLFHSSKTLAKSSILAHHHQIRTIPCSRPLANMSSNRCDSARSVSPDGRKTIRLAPPRSPFSPDQQTHWILDFDGTITEKDTIDHLVSIPTAGDLVTHPNTWSNWKKLVSVYAKEHGDYIATRLPDRNAHTPRRQEEELLEGLRPIEERSLARVFTRGIFFRITGSELENGAWELIETKKIKLRTGCHSFLERVSRKSTAEKVSVLSVNWSSIFVSTCIEAGCCYVDPDTEEDIIPEVYANEFTGVRYGSNDRSTGEIMSHHEHRILTAEDKLRQMRTIRDEAGTAQCVYVGDGWQDLLCLLDAELGICIRDEDNMSSTQRMLADALGRLNIECQHLDKWTPESTSKIWWARDFEEIVKWWEQIDGAVEADDAGSGDDDIIPTIEGNAT